ncbi:MAG TPA: acetyl-CoA hydrolase/transferase C-terminal domain-containing protein [Dongiaceae bacterium]
MARYHSDARSCVDAIIRDVGKKIVLGLPLGLGKANHIANELFARAAADRSIDLHIFTALTLEKVPTGPDLLQRFAAPISARLFGDYPDLAYAKAVRAGNLPSNVRVSEFYLTAGQWLSSPGAQQAYVSANYTDVPALLLELGINVIAQLVAKRGSVSGAEFSLSCNPDITLDLLPAIDKRRREGVPFVLAGEVNDELPFMGGDAALPESTFDHVLDAPALRYSLFAPPKEAISLSHYAIALRIAALVRDGGTIQMGIGALGDAVAWALIMRHRHNDAFREAANRLGIVGELAPFQHGLYGVSEMFVDVFLDLYREGILRRRAKDGALLHAAFFIGPKEFYRRLRQMDEAERANFHMKPISFTNGLSGPDAADRRAMRRKAAFINEGMIATLLGEIASDTRDDAIVVSGVGGQYNFVVQAHMLEDARSIIAVNATRTARGKTTSNIRLSASHATVPRHLRDIVVSEYGVANLRGRTDRDCIAAIIAIADSSFQRHLLEAAQSAGKIERRFEIPPQHRRNHPDVLEALLAPLVRSGRLPAYPFGTDLDDIERNVAAALQGLKTAPGGYLLVFSRAIRASFLARSKAAQAVLERLGLEPPKSPRDMLLARLVKWHIHQAESGRTADRGRPEASAGGREQT